MQSVLLLLVLSVVHPLVVLVVEAEVLVVEAHQVRVKALGDADHETN
jgi:hypothetical protein